MALAGVVFNGLFEDLKNWSCYGPNSSSGTSYGCGGGKGRSSASPAAGIDPDPDERAALPMAGSYTS